jgi:hypothetical protein
MTTTQHNIPVGRRWLAAATLLVATGAVATSAFGSTAVANAEPNTTTYNTCNAAHRARGVPTIERRFDCCIQASGTWNGTYPTGYCTIGDVMDSGQAGQAAQGTTPPLPGTTAIAGPGPVTSLAG